MMWWQYLLLVNLYLLLFYGFYSLLLRRETFFQLNRLYLVSSAILSFLIPVMQANWVKNMFITQMVKYTIYGRPMLVYSLKPIAEKAPVSIGELFAGIYLTGVLFLMLRFVWQLIKLNKIIKSVKQDLPYSFFKKIKIDNQADGSPIIATHEQVHARQWHSADVLIIEAMMIVNWFNPVVYFYRVAIKHIHEFIADSYTVKTGTDKADYALLLLTQTFNTSPNHLVSHFFNHSLLKQRIIMLQKSKSHRIKLIKYGLSAPLFILMLILSSATVNNSLALNKVNKTAQKIFDLSADTSIITKIRLVNNTTGAIDSSSKIKIALIHSDNRSVIVADSPISSLSKPGTDTISDDNNELFTAVENAPQFPGGQNEFYKYLAKNIRYPAVDRDEKIQGTVIISFIVEKNGSLSHIEALKKPSETLGAEAVRVMRASPDWIPGYQNGHIVRVQYSAPVSFVLTDGESSPLTLQLLKPDTGKKPVVITFDNNSLVNNPLYVLNGKIIKKNVLQVLDPNDIESIAVLKDKTATDLYGKDAVNGVVVITTKKK